MTLKEDAGGCAPDAVIAALPDGYDVIGDAAILALPQEARAYGEAIATGILARRSHVKKVLNKVSMVEGDRRVARYEVLAGEGTVTVHREHGFFYRLDLRETFFNPRLGEERQRVASQVTGRERVLMPFAGVGPFAIPAAARGATVTAIEKNPAACHLLMENARINKVRDRIAIINGDAFDLGRMLKAVYDRAIVPTPYGMDSILETLLPVVKEGGLIHFYTFRKKAQIPGLIEEYRKLGLETVLYRRCGNVAPGVSRWSFDLLKIR
ncbi:class I SAM-dependent methyltransferase [Methanocella arvoryzae]|uniref:SAM-dependent methyltransferase TRM5/TYW2-type domain-containing protein n=1 Tax=Methanocella arvoryzae (strain DSM 22066 / NBRC 105507 / MRE50) TaxID=351160 RepID=Q0W4W1_METAR|nr:class I SAM-dependent methyltransferase family protein [Methanocella arvoryzae]CAJ36582.1 conserved hypothetical protein [Methanocella arvoryzae MRE50]